MRVAFESLLPARLEAQSDDVLACALSMAALTYDIYILNPIGILAELAMYYWDCVHGGGNGGDWYAHHLPPVIIVAHCTSVTEWSVWYDDYGVEYWESYTYNICD